MQRYVMTMLITTRLPAFSMVETKVYTEYLAGLNLQLTQLAAHAQRQRLDFRSQNRSRCGEAMSNDDPKYSAGLGYKFATQ
jgi:hypothetical protein